MIEDCLAGIRRAPGEVLRLFEIETMSELVLAVLAVSVIFTIVAVPFARAAYRRRMTRFMSFRQLREPPQAWWQRRTHRGRQTAPASDDRMFATTPGLLADAMHCRLKRVQLATLAGYAAFVAGAAFALPFHAAGDAAGIAFGAAVFAAGPAFINATPRRGQVLVALLLAASLFAILASQTGTDEDLLEIVGGAAILFAFQMVSTGRTSRALSVPLALFSMSAFAGLLMGAFASVAAASCVGAVPATIEASGTMTATVLTAAALGIWAGNRLVAALSYAHERGWISDISLVSLFGLTAVAGLVIFSSDREDVSAAVMVAAWFAWTALPIVAYALVLRLMREPAGARSLLMLRVFSRNRRAERVLDTLQTQWRYAGPVLQIGGPDLARLNVDPQEFARFLASRAHELFVPGDVPKAQLLASLDLVADREGRFRISEVFCFDTAWHSVVQTLIETTDVILLDLRGFGRQRAGTAFELVQLASRQRLNSTVVIGDASTDWAYFEELAGAAKQQAVRLDAQQPDLVDTCIAALLAAGRTGPGTTTPRPAP